MLTLGNVEYYPMLSEESVAFSATLYWNGQNAGVVKNRGEGTPNAYQWENKELREKVMDWAVQQEVDYPEFETLDVIIDSLLT